MDPLAAILGGVVGALIGAAVAWFWADRKSRAIIANLETNRALAEQRATATSQELEKARQEIQKTQTDTTAARQQLAQSQAAAAALTAQLAANRENLTDQKRLLDQANEKMTQAFAAVSRDALAKSNEAFLLMAEAKFKTLSAEATGTLDERKAQIATLLQPLQEALGKLETQRTEAYASLRQQIGSLSQVQNTLTTQTSQLVSALTRPNVRGQWGEIALRKLVELAGMTDRCDFTEQTSINTDEGRLRPDMIVRLPSDRCVVIDCKAVMGAFLEAACAPDETTRQQHLRRHADLIRARARDLSSKAYWSQFPNTPEFVVLFLPGEAFLYAACEYDQTLLEDCIADRVIIATPTTLIALLKSVEYGWRQQAISENAEAIRKLGTEIYDRLAILADNMVKLGRSLDTAVDHYNKTVGTLDTRLLVSARKISELGARSEKDLPDLPPVDKRARELSATLHPEKSPLLPQ